ncbi:hypothetical protein VDGL01_08216 [Verticillium dahliae]
MAKRTTDESGPDGTLVNESNSIHLLQTQHAPDTTRERGRPNYFAGPMSSESCMVNRSLLDLTPTQLAGLRGQMPGRPPAYHAAQRPSRACTYGTAPSMSVGEPIGHFHYETPDESTSSWRAYKAGRQRHEAWGAMPGEQGRLRCA